MHTSWSGPHAHRVPGTEVPSLSVVTRRASWPALMLLLALAVPAVAQPVPGAKPAAPKPVPKPAAGNQALDAIAAMVNDEPVLASDVEEQLFMYLQRAQARPDSAQLDTLRRQVLDQLIDEKLLIAEAKRQGVTVAPAEVNKQVEAAIVEAKQRLGGEAAFAQQLARENTTETRLRERYKADPE